MELTVFHSSRHRGMKIISPRSGTHGTPYVYATKDSILSLVFVVNRTKNFGDFSLGIGRDHLGKICLCERYRNAFTDSYSGVSGAQYTLPANTFLNNQTSWSEEVVSPSPVVPISEFPLKDMEPVLLQNVQAGKIALYKYPERPIFIPKDDEDLIFKALVWSKAALGSPVLGKLDSIHPVLCQKVHAIIENKVQRASHLEKWCKLFGDHHARSAYRELFPQDNLMLSPKDPSQETDRPQRGQKVRDSNKGPLVPMPNK